MTAPRFDNALFSDMLQSRNAVYSLRELADLTGVSAPTLSRLERNGTTPDLETFFALCAWLDVSPAFFMRGASDDAACVSCKQHRQILAQIAELAQVPQ